MGYTSDCMLLTSPARARRPSSAATPSRRPRAATVLALVAAVAIVPAAHAQAAPAQAEPPTQEDVFRWDLASRLEDGPVLAPGTPMAGVLPQQARGGYAAKIIEDTGVYAAPGSTKRIWTARRRTPHTGNATRLTVQRARFDAAGRAWLAVRLPIRPNGTIGWVRFDNVTLTHASWFVAVRLDARRLEVWRDGRMVKATRVVIGARSTPTPVGDFAVYEIARQGSSTGFLGPWALHLTAFSDVLDNYGGGPGRVAVHGRGPDSIRDAPLGAAASHGCVRIPDDVVSWMARHVPPGTPVRIGRT